MTRLGFTVGSYNDDDALVGVQLYASVVPLPAAAWMGMALLCCLGLGKNVKLLRPPQDAVTPAWGGLLLVNRAPHPNAVKIFINWLLSREGQAHWARINSLNSRRVDVTPGNPDAVVDPKKMGEYFHPNREENAKLRGDAMKFARSLLK